jgi:hypothetical protein
VPHGFLIGRARASNIKVDAIQSRQGCNRPSHAKYRGSDLWSRNMSSANIILFPLFAQAGQSQNRRLQNFNWVQATFVSIIESSRRFPHLAVTFLIVVSVFSNSTPSCRSSTPPAHLHVRPLLRPARQTYQPRAAFGIHDLGLSSNLYSKHVVPDSRYRDE